MPKNKSVPEKTSDLYFHSESNAEKLKKKCIDLGLSITENLSVSEALDVIKTLNPPESELSFYIFIVSVVSSSDSKFNIELFSTTRPSS